jgi:tetratricopeptide (TPR) repeat protein
VLGKLGASGDLLPSALRWLRRRAPVEQPDQDQSVAGESGGAEAGVAVDASAAEPSEIALPAAEPLPTAEDVPDLRAMVEADRGNARLRWQLGLALVAARKLNLALAHLEVAAAQDPSLDQGELADVRELQRAERLVRRYPRDPELHLALGRLYLALDQGDAALAQLEEAVRLRPDLGPAHTLLGFEYAFRGRIARAREHWGRASDLDPADEMSRTGLAAIADGRDPLRAIWQAATS